MLLVLISIIWLSTIVFAVALCSAAARGDDDDGSRVAIDAHFYASVHELNVIRVPGDVADAAHGARGHLPSSVLAPPAGFA